ncbi:rhomboid family intramembrane serine protease, partial [Xanthomonas oryzae pv. oryzae]
MTTHSISPDTATQNRLDRSRVLRAFNVSLAAVLLLVAVFTAQGMFDWRAWAVAPLQTDGLIGILTAPLL